MKNIIVLGAGMVGSAMAIDLSNQHQVTCTDLSETALARLKSKAPAIQTMQLDVTDAGKLKSTVEPYDLVVCAVPGFLGFNTLRRLIEAGKHVIDISFFPENSLELDALARQHNVTAIVDCGVAPGMDNIILGYLNSKMKITDFECLVGGLPKVRKWPFAYKAPFSPIDVIEEYTRPARYVENKHLVTKPAMSDVEHREFPGVGTLEAFNSDGLRSIIHTMPHIPNMKEKTLRYPGHIEKIQMLRDAGFFGLEPIELNGAAVRPIDFTSKVLFKEWKLGEHEEEMTVMSVWVKGTNAQGKQTEITYRLHDTYNHDTQTSSMARTTGYTATAAVNLFIDGLFTKRGVFPPELISGDEQIFQYFIHYLNERGVKYTKDENTVE